MRSDILATRTVNYLDLVGNGRVFIVPKYQRDYSWTEDQWEDLWQDLTDLKGGDRHYMGAMVIEALSDREASVIDGQQRLATLSILSLAVIHGLEGLARDGIEADPNQERARALRARYIGEKDLASLVETSKLTLNETDNGFYQDYLVQSRTPVNPLRLPKSNQLLLGAYRYFQRKISEDTSFRDGATLAALLSETVARHLLFILITVEDEMSAYTVFETLNARGLELSTTDLLKNYLFSRMTSGSDLAHLQRRWKELISVVGQARFPEFLRYHLLCTHRKIRKERLFKTVRQDIRSASDVLRLLDQLESRAEVYAAVGDPGHSFWNDRPECIPFVRELRLFRVRQMMPLVFAAAERFDTRTFAQTLRMVAIIAFRYTIVSALNTNELEPVYHDAARAVLDGRAKGVRDLFQILRRIYVSDDIFRQNFANLTSETAGGRKRITKYILLRLESQQSGRFLDTETDPASIEHILPENPTAEWAEAIPSDRWDTAIYRLGNLSPIEASLNREIGNGSYPEKLAVYAKSQYLLSRSLPELAPDEWSLSLIDQRQQTMSDLAVQIWRCDY